jgi:hypothetical protein
MDEETQEVPWFELFACLILLLLACVPIVFIVTLLKVLLKTCICKWQGNTWEQQDLCTDASLPPNIATNGSHTLATLKNEQRRLLNKLQEYGRRFYVKHNRNVSSYDDMKPMVRPYCRYKKLTAHINALQQQQES